MNYVYTIYTEQLLKELYKEIPLIYYRYIKKEFLKMFMSPKKRQKKESKETKKNQKNKPRTTTKNLTEALTCN